MNFEGSVRDALRREAERHDINTQLDPATIAKARASRFLSLLGISVIAATVVLAGVSLAGNLQLFGNKAILPGFGGSEAGGVPHLLVTAPEWEVERADQYGESGEMSFSDGEHYLDLFWRPRDQHEDYVQDRENGSARSWDIDIAGHRGILFQYEGSVTFTALWLAGDYSMEFRGEGFDDLDAYLAVAETLQQVDEETWLAAMPEDVVQPSDRGATVDAMLTDIPIPRGFDVDVLRSGKRIQDRYQLGAEVTGAVTCAWIGQWVDATRDADRDLARQAVSAMRTSTRWAILLEMDEAGDFPEAVWDYAEEMADGQGSGKVSNSIDYAYQNCNEFGRLS